MLWVTFAAASRLKSLVPFGLLSGSLLACGLIMCMPSIAHADDDAPLPAPRTVVIIGGASVALFAANNQLYAFVDRLDDNAPVGDAQLSVEINEEASITPTAVPIAMNRAAAGRFVGPLKRVGRRQDAFMVLLQSSAGSGDAPATIIYTDAVVTPVAIPTSSISKNTTLAITGVSGALGAIMAALLMLCWSGWWKRKV